MRRTYEPWRPNPEAQYMVDHISEICADYARQGYFLTLRGLYYQLVGRGLFPDSRRFTWTGTRWTPDPEGTKNALPNYRWLIWLATKARLGGHLDWDHLVDNERNLAALGHWNNPADIIHSAAAGYRIDMWYDQPRRVEVWVEKAALGNVVSRAAQAWDVGWMACKGYVSLSEMYEAGRRLAGYINNDGQDVTILYLGDHDPSGIDMTRDIADRLQMFTRAGPPRLEVRRIALNLDQIRQMDLPSDPAKLGDSRTNSYIQEFGEDCWELDAMDPPAMDRLIRDAIAGLVDQDLYDERQARQNSERETLGQVNNHWDQVVEYLDSLED